MVSSSKLLSPQGPLPGIGPAPGFSDTQGSSALNTWCHMNAQPWGNRHRIRVPAYSPAAPQALNTTAHLACTSLPSGPPSLAEPPWYYLIDGQLFSTSSTVAVVVARGVKLFIQVFLAACVLCAHSVQSSIRHPWKEKQQQAQNISLEGGGEHEAKEPGDFRTGITSLAGSRRSGASLSCHPCLADGKLQSLTSLLQVT